jgi:hypothetical protein
MHTPWWLFVFLGLSNDELNTIYYHIIILSYALLAERIRIRLPLLNSGIQSLLKERFYLFVSPTHLVV